MEMQMEYSLEKNATIRLVRNAIFFEPNIPSVFPHEIPKCVSYNITYQGKAWKGTFCLHKCGAWIIVFV